MLLMIARAEQHQYATMTNEDDYILFPSFVPPISNVIAAAPSNRSFVTKQPSLLKKFQVWGSSADSIYYKLEETMQCQYKKV